jgi:glycosyltransferase involved in cell wall biosynthesis
MRKIYICFIQTNAYSLFNEENNSIHGGSELQLYLIAKELSKNDDFKISFITGDFGQKNREYYPKIQLFKSFTPKSNDSLLKKLFQATKYYRLFKKLNADIYFTSAANSTVGLVSLFCKLNNKKHIHRTAHEEEVNFTYSRKGILGKIFTKGLIYSDLVITQNQNHQKLLKENFGINAQILKNSFAIKEIKPSKKDSILWVARCDYWKRPELFIHLAKRVPDERFIMIAPPANEKENYQKEIKDKSKQIKNLTFIDRVPFNNIQVYFNSAKVFINTSEFEGFPNTFLQAGNGKTPVLSLNVNPDNFINEYNCGFFCENDFDKLVGYTKILIDNKKVWEEKSENIYKYIKENHDIQINVEQLTKMIYELVGKKNEKIYCSDIDKN